MLEETKTKYDLGSATLYDLYAAESAYTMAETNLFSANQNFKPFSSFLRIPEPLSPADRAQNPAPNEQSADYSQTTFRGRTCGPGGTSQPPLDLR